MPPAPNDRIQHRRGNKWSELSLLQKFWAKIQVLVQPWLKSVVPAKGTGKGFDLVYCVSDLHLGNSRPTTDVYNDKLAAFKAWLESICQDAKGQNLVLILNGDFLDLWAAIPSPATDDAFGDSDARARLQSVLGNPANRQCILEPLKRLFDGSKRRLVLVIGNHDDLLRSKPALAADLKQALPALEIFADSFTIPSFFAHFEHGHYYDADNRFTAGKPAPGRVIVEHLVNKVEDASLLPPGDALARLAPLGSPQALELRQYDQLYPSDGVADLVAYVAGKYGIPGLDDAIFPKEVQALKESGHVLEADIAQGLGRQAAEEILKGLSVFHPGGDLDKYRDVAAKLFGRDCRIVVFGHTHAADAAPALGQPGTQARQYVNTGAGVNMFRMQSNAPLASNQSVFVKLSKTGALIRVEAGNWAASKPGGSQGYNDQGITGSNLVDPSKPL